MTSARCRVLRQTSRGSLVRRVRRSPVIAKPRPGARSHSLGHSFSLSLSSGNTNRLGLTNHRQEVIIPGSGWTNIALSHSISNDGRFRATLNIGNFLLTGSRGSNKDCSTLIACLLTGSSRF
jgi:hypothetical protein